MGLDVYMYKVAAKHHVVDYEQAEKEFTASDSQRWPEPGIDYGLVADDPALRGTSDHIEIDSTKYPEHLFKIGYMRSSYNEGGINHVLSDRIGVDLYSLFAQEFDAPDAIPDWQASLERAKEARDLFSAYLEVNGRYGVIECSMNPFSGLKTDVDSKKAALEVFNAHRIEHKWDEPHNDPLSSSGYSNNQGEFFPEGIKVVALLDGVSEHGGLAALTGNASVIPATYAIYEDDGNGYEWYIQALDIVAEMCEWAIANSNDEWVYYLSWSG